MVKHDKSPQVVSVDSGFAKQLIGFKRASAYMIHRRTENDA